MLGGGRLAVRDHADADLVDVRVDVDLAELRRTLQTHGWTVRG